MRPTRAVAVDQPRGVFVLVGGWPASGKTTLAPALANAFADGANYRGAESSPARCQRLSWLMIPVLICTELANASGLSAAHLSAEPPMSFITR